MPSIRWGVHPVLEAALTVLGEERADALADVLPPKRPLELRTLVEIGLVCSDHVVPLVRPKDADRFQTLVALVRRELRDRQRQKDAAWQRDLFHARRDTEDGRGAIVVAALAAELAWADLMRDAPGVGAEAVGLARRVTGRAAELLSKDERALMAFVRALCATMQHAGVTRPVSHRSRPGRERS